MTLVLMRQEMRRGLVILSYRGLPLNTSGGDEEPRERLRMDFGDGVWTTVELPDMAVCALYLRDLVTRQPHIIKKVAARTPIFVNLRSGLTPEDPRDFTLTVEDQILMANRQWHFIVIGLWPLSMCGWSIRPMPGTDPEKLKATRSIHYRSFT